MAISSTETISLIDGFSNLLNLSKEELLFGAWRIFGVSAPPFLWLCVVFGLLIGIFYAIRFFLSCRNLTNQISKINEELKKRDLPRKKLGQQEFEDVSEIFRNNKELSASWNEFSETLVFDGENQVFNTRQAEEFFSTSKLINSKVKLGFYTSIPSLATSIGLTLTFIAILLGLSKITIGVGGQVEGISELVSSLSGKFISSIAALLFALIYTVFYQRRLDKLKGTINELTSHINGFFPRRAAEFYLRDIGKQTSSINTEIRNLSGDIVGRFSQGMKESAGPTLDKINEALERIGESMNQMNVLLETSNSNIAENMGELLNNIAAKFQQNLSGSARGEFDRLSDTLTTVSELLTSSTQKNDELMNGVANMLERMNSSSTRQAERSAQQVEKNGEQISKLVEQLMETSQTSASNFAKEMNETLLNIKSTGEAQLQSAREQSESMKQSMKESFRELSDSLSSIVTELFDGIGVSMKAIVSDLSEKGSRLTEKLEKQGREVETNYESKVQSLDRNLATLLTGFEQTQQVVREFVETSKKSSDIGVASLKDAQTVLDNSAKSFTEVIASSSSVMNNFRSFADTVKSASGALEISLRQITKVEEATTQRISEAKRHDLILADSVREYMNALESSKEVLGSYREAMGQVDGGLAHLLAGINKGLESYHHAVTNNMGDHIKKWDEAFSKGYSNLNGSVVSLTESIDELRDLNRQK